MRVRPWAIPHEVGPYFEVHRRGEHEGLLIGPTVFSRIDEQPFLVFSRRWEWPDGSFRGVTTSAVRADHFLDFAERLSHECHRLATVLVVQRHIG